MTKKDKIILLQKKLVEKINEMKKMGEQVDIYMKNEDEENLKRVHVRLDEIYKEIETLSEEAKNLTMEEQNVKNN